MKKLTIAAFAALAISAIAPAQANPHMEHGNMTHGQKMGMMNAHECCMQGLSAEEKSNAMKMMKGWSAEEKAAWDKRCSLCMADPHTALMKMEKSGMKPTDKMIHDHMMGGLSKSEQMGMGKIMADKSHAELVMKMAENCCMYGVKHAGKMSK